MNGISMSCLAATEKQKAAIARLLNWIGVENEDVESYDIDREAANHFLKQLSRKINHQKSDLDI